MRYDQFKINLLEAILDEAEMTPKAFQDFLASPLVTGMKMGFELESVIRGAREEYENEPEDDMGYDERTHDIESILEFFSNGDDANGEQTINKLRNKLYDDFMAWQDAEFDDYFRTDEAQVDLKEFIREYLEEKDYTDRQQRLEFDNAEEGKVSDIYAEAEMTAIEKLRDEWNENDTADWDKYADAHDMNYMSEVYYKYDNFLYWPYTSYGDGEERYNVEWVADALLDETGISAYASDSYHGASRGRAQEKGQWIIEPDSSISTDDSDEAGLEFVSPALEINEALKQMQQVLEFIREHGYTNSSTGLHINISVPDYTTDKLDYVKLAIFLGDKHVLEQFDRLSNHYCDGAYKKIGNKVQQMKGDELKAVMAKMKEGLTLAASKIIHTGYTNKYTSINTKEGYIEFRGPGGDYLDKKPEELVNTALRMALALRIATDPEMYKQEYQKRLYKVLTDADEKDDLTKFKDYVSRFQTADKETRSYIIQTIQAERESRKAKKKKPEGESRPYWMVRRRGQANGGGMAVFADTAYDAIKDVAKSWGIDPIYLYANPMADEQPQGGEEKEWSVRDGLGRYVGTVGARSSDEAVHIFGSTRNIDTRNYTASLTDDNPPHGGGATFVIDYNGTKYRQRANSADEARDLLSARIGVERNLLWDIQEEPQGMATGGVTVDGNARGNYHLVNSNRSIDTRMSNVSREEAHSTARRMEQEYGLESGNIHVTRINDQTGSHNFRIYDIQNPDVFSVVAADTRTDAVERWNIVNPERPADVVDAVPDEGAMKYEFTIALQALNSDAAPGTDRFIYPQELYKQRTGREEIPVRKVWATSKEQAIGKVRSFFREFFDVPPDWLKINVVGI
jgi:hypothetical protein